MFGREPRTTLPQQKDGHVKTQTEVKAAENDAHAKSRMKHYADQRNRVATSDIKVGDTVLLRRDTKRDKTTAPFHTNPYEVISRKGNMVTCQAGGRKVTRNSMWFRKITMRERQQKINHQESDNDDDDDDFAVNPNDRVEPVQRPRRNLRRPRRFRDYVT